MRDGEFLTLTDTYIQRLRGELIIMGSNMLVAFEPKAPHPIAFFKLWETTRFGNHYTSLQLSIGRLERLFVIQPPPIRLFLASVPPERSQPLRQNRVREVVARIDPIRVHGAEVLDLQLDQGFGQLLGISQADGEFIWVGRVNMGFLLII